MSFVVGDEIITEEIPVEVEAILAKMKERTREKSKSLMHAIANSEKYIAYVIPGAGMVLFSEVLEEDRKIFRYLISGNGELFIDNKQRRGDMFCPLFAELQEKIKELTGSEPKTEADDPEYRIYDSFMPKIVDAVERSLNLM